jgi:anti-sigma regulatory factor (Ser/Thr protein kinase)
VPPMAQETTADRSCTPVPALLGERHGASPREHSTTGPELQQASSGLPHVGATPPPGRSRGRSVPPAPEAGVRVPPFIARRHPGFGSGRPLQDFLEFGALAGAVPCARLHTRQVLWEWGLASLGESAELVVSELIANAVKASWAVSAPAVRLWLILGPGEVLILAWDQSTQPPVRMLAEDEAENGRGLTLVDAVSASCGWCSCADGGGKLVWALVGADARPPG